MTDVAHEVRASPPRSDGENARAQRGISRTFTPDPQSKGFDLGPDYFHVTPAYNRWEVFSWYVFAWAMGGFNGLGGVFSIRFLTLVVVGAASVSEGHTVGLFGVALLPTSYIQMLNVVSVVLQVFVFFLLGPLADLGSFRKWGMLGTAWIAAVFVFLVWICTPQIVGTDSTHTVTAAFFIIVTVAAALNSIYFAAYLPLLARNHVDVLQGQRPGPEMFQKLASFSTAASFVGSIAALVLGVAISLAVSTDGPMAFVRAGFNNVTNTTAAGMCQLDTLPPPTTGELRQTIVVLTITAVWVVVFSIPALLFLLPRPGLPLRGGRALVDGWKMMGKTVAHVRRQRHLLIFLASYFLYWDGMATLLFASTVLFQTIDGMTTTLIGAAVIVAFICAAGASVALFFIQKHFPRAFTSKNIILGSLLLTCGLPLWAFFGLKTVPEAFLAGAYFGIVLGAASAHVRASFSQMIPPQRESEFWSLFSIVDKASNFLGPFLLVLINQATCNFRMASFSVLGFVIAGGLLLLFCDFDSAIQRAKEMEPLPRDPLQGKDQAMPKDVAQPEAAKPKQSSVVGPPLELIDDSAESSRPQKDPEQPTA
jgi:UMF1 family MFS transporter